MGKIVQFHIHEKSNLKLMQFIVLEMFFNEGFFHDL